MNIHTSGNHSETKYNSNKHILCFVNIHLEEADKNSE